MVVKGVEDAEIKDPGVKPETPDDEIVSIRHDPVIWTI